MTTVLVTFDMWGRRCMTRFNTVAEALAWIDICYEKGAIAPVAFALQNDTDSDVLSPLKQESF